MKKIDKLFVKSYLGPFFLTTSIVVFIFLMRFLMSYFNQFLGKNLDGIVFAKLFFYFTLMTIPTSLPLATLLASLMCFGNMGEHSELTAMKSAGISLPRLIRPTFILSFFVAVFMLLYNNYVNPWANLKGWSLLYDIKTAKPALNIQEGIFYNEIPQYRIKVGKKFADNKTLKDIMVYDHTNGNGNRSITVADSGRMYTINNDNELVFELFKGTNYSEGNNYNNSTQLTKYSFQKNKMVFPLGSFGLKTTDENSFKYHHYMKNIPQLNNTVDSLQKIIEKRNEQYSVNLKNMNAYNIPRVTQNKVLAIKPGKWIDSLLQKSSKNSTASQLYYAAISKINNEKGQFQSDIYGTHAIQKDIWAADLERWNKVASAFSCLAMFLIGASLGSIIKRGGFGVPVLISIGFFILYYIMQQIGKKYAEEGLIPAVVGSWMPIIVLFIIGNVLMLRAKNE